jgi:tetratricopeptide (TPR) repeat protein
VTVEPLHRQPSAIALKSFEQAVKVFNRRQYPEARTLFENMIAKYPQELEILARVQVYLQVCLQRLASTTSAPETASSLYDQGVFALNKGDLKAARSLFERALRLNPNDPHLFYSMAVTLLQSGLVDECLVHLERCIQLQPRFRSQALNDSDFTELRENRQFLALMGISSPFDRLESRK